jgi:hypothetical protein
MTHYQNLLGLLTRRSRKPVFDQCLANLSALRVDQVRAARARMLSG